MSLRWAVGCAALFLPMLSQAQTDYCTMPGELVTDDAVGDFVPFVPASVPVPGTGLDLGAVHVAEPADDDKGRIHFSMQIDRQSAAATPQTRYMLEFTTPDGIERYLSYTPYPLEPMGSVLPGEEQVFTIGHYEETSFGRGAFNDGAPDADSSAGADGRVTFVVQRKALGRLDDGDTILDIVASTRIYNLTGTFPLDNSDAPGAYVIRGNQSCKGKAASVEARAVEDKSGTSFGGAFAPLLLLLAGLARARCRC